MTRLPTIAGIELRRVLRDPATFLILVIFALLAAYAVQSGTRWAAARADMIDLAVKEADETMAQRRQTFAETLDKGEKPGFGLIFATAIPYRAGLPNAPLAALSAGQAEAYPAAAAISPFSDSGTIFDRFATGLENPAVLNAGRFDLAFVLVFLLPLLLLAGIYDLWARERESGIARMQLAQSIRPATLVGIKALVRGGALLLPMTVIAVAFIWAAGLHDPGGLAALTAVLLLYGGFWILLAVLVNLAAATSTSAALACGTAWLAITLVIPALAAASADLLRPRPIASAHINDVREAGQHLRREQAAARKAAEQRAGEPRQAQRAYPDNLWAQREDIAGRDERLGPIHRRHADAQARYRSLADGLSLVSPAIVAQDAFDRIAGTDADRALAFQAQARAFAATTRQLAFDWMDADRLLTLSDYDGGLPRFAFQEPDRSGPLFFDIAVLAVFCALIVWLAGLAIRRRFLLRL